MDAVQTRDCELPRYSTVTGDWRLNMTEVSRFKYAYWIYYTASVRPDGMLPLFDSRSTAIVHPSFPTFSIATLRLLACRFQLDFLYHHMPFSFILNSIILLSVPFYFATVVKNSK